MKTNDLRHEVILFVLKSLITHHYIIIYCVKKFKNRFENLKKCFVIRNKDNLNNEKFTSDLESNLLNYFENLPACTINNSNDTFNGFILVIQETIIKHMSLKRYLEDKKTKRKTMNNKANFS